MTGFVPAPAAAPSISDPHIKDRVESSHIPLDFNVKRIDDVVLAGPPELTSRDLMSPYVWRDSDGRFGIMVRAVPRADTPKTDTGIIWAGWSEDGEHFTMFDAPSIRPGPGPEDEGGVEDPTVVYMKDGRYIVYYTGVRADMAHGELCFAEGPSPDSLTKSGVALASSKSEGNTKEASIDHTPSGEWRLFYEYAADEASRIGLAIGSSECGPWTEQPTPFMPRENSWDDWHLSTGPLLRDDPERPVMFYNGATRDARWRIGWVAFDREYCHVVARGIQPLITPPPTADRADTDIAFAGSVVVTDDGAIWLYYSLEDRRLARALIRRS